MRPNFGEGVEKPPYINQRGEQLVAAGLPPLTSLVALGDSWMAKTATAAAPVIAIPTTGSLIALYNAEPENGKSYVIDSLFLLVVANTAAVQSHCLLANLAPNPSTIVAPAIGITPNPMRGSRAYGGLARVAVGLALDATNGVAANWFPLGPSIPNSNTPQIGSAIDWPLDGSIIVPPKGLFALTALAGAATASSVQIGFRWHELLLPPIT